MMIDESLASDLAPLIERYKELMQIETELRPLQPRLGEETATRYAIRSAALRELHDHMDHTAHLITHLVMTAIDDTQS